MSGPCPEIERTGPAELPKLATQPSWWLVWTVIVSPPKGGRAHHEQREMLTACLCNPRPTTMSENWTFVQWTTTVP